MEGYLKNIVTQRKNALVSVDEDRRWLEAAATSFLRPWPVHPLAAVLLHRPAATVQGVHHQRRGNFLLIEESFHNSLSDGS